MENLTLPEEHKPSLDNLKKYISELVTHAERQAEREEIIMSICSDISYSLTFYVIEKEAEKFKKDFDDLKELRKRVYRQNRSLAILYDNIFLVSLQGPISFNTVKKVIDSALEIIDTLQNEKINVFG